MVLIFVASVAVAWWLFGFSKDRDELLTTTRYRLFGRVVRIDTDFKNDGVVDSSLRYTWRNPARHHEDPRIIFSDHDADGRWDLWIVPGGKDAAGFPLATFRVDTDRDGRADWTFVDQYASERTYARISAGRGF